MGLHEGASENLGALEVKGKSSDKGWPTPVHLEQEPIYFSMFPRGP